MYIRVAVRILVVILAIRGTIICSAALHSKFYGQMAPYAGVTAIISSQESQMKGIF
jgi:hypothetical protein